MMHPKYERGRMLSAAIDAAMHELDDPIDRIEVRGGKVRIWAGSGRLALNYGYDNAYGADGSAMPGSGCWWAAPIEWSEEDGAGKPRGLLRRLLGRD